MPIGPEYYLNTTQIEHIDAHVAAYNDIISATANEANLAMADVNQLLLEAEPGIYFDAIAFNTEFVSGGVFSLDGIHLSARGYAIVANAFIDAINNQYEANIPKVAIGNYPGIQFHKLYSSLFINPWSSMASRNTLLKWTLSFLV